jgi:two-component system sensor histidine kinase ChvG
MALDSEPTTLSDAPRAGLLSAIKGLAGPLRSATAPIRWLADRLSGSALGRVISRNLLNRILATNLVGLSIIIGGILYQSQYHEWLIDAKRESLKVQGEMIAAAIASDARVEKGRIEFDVDKLRTQSSPSADDGFASMQLSMGPELVAPILRRLIQPTRTRARIYGLDGTLIVDSAKLLMRGQLSRDEPAVSSTERVRTRNFWTRLKAWLIDPGLPVYREIGSANGLSYPEVRKALTGTPMAMLLLNDDGEQIVSMAVPIMKSNAVEGVLLLSSRPGDIDKILDEEQRVVWALATVALVATLVTSLLLARTVAGPMRRLSEAADHVSRNIAVPKQLPQYSDRTDEVGQMATAFRTMTEALYRRVEASERFAADVAHELKNPLTAARSTAESLAYAKSDAHRKELVGQIQNELKRLNRLITDVSNASRLDAELARQQMKPVDSTIVAQSVTQIFRDILTDDSRKVRMLVEPAAFDGAFLVSGDEGRLAQVLTNLVDNAVSFSPDNGTVTLKVRHNGGGVEFVIEDEGPGIPEDRLAIIFERFYTDRPATEALLGKNSGLGLSISREIVRAHGGQIWAENRRPPESAAAGDNHSKTCGSRFVVRIPALHASQRSGHTSGRRA